MASVRFVTLLLVGLIAYSAALPQSDDEGYDTPVHDADAYDDQDFDADANETQQVENDPGSPGGFEALETTRSFQKPPSIAVPYIIQGRKTDIVNSPWQIRLQIFKPSVEFPEGYYASCGGSIIDSFWIVTAAHCVDDAIEIKVILGSTDADPRSSPYAVTLMADQYAIHPQYGKLMELVNGVKTSFGNRFDVALVHVAQEIKFNSAVKTITIEHPSWTAHPDETFTAYGWGQTSGTNRESISATLRSVRIPVVSKEYCNQEFDVEIGDEMFCGGARDRGVCKGDSGGPLVNERKNLVGIVSYGTPECNSYSIFTKVYDQAIHSWIVKTVNSMPDVVEMEEEYPILAFGSEEKAEGHFYPGSTT